MSDPDRPRENVRCWCGNTELVPFSKWYARCPVCETLVSTHDPAQPSPQVKDDATDFYGKDYWFKHQESDLGFGNITSRARTDLAERAQHWLRTLLKYKRPPGATLELGCAHGGFVALVKWAGFDATGLELSPWVVEFARKTFEIPVLLGPLEDQALADGSLDVIAHFDVLEHLPDPEGTMRRAVQLLKDDGVMLLQTPCYPEGATYDELVARGDKFLEQLKPNEHLYLFSRKSVAELFRRLGAPHVAFEPAYFWQYDMFPAIGKRELQPAPQEQVEAELQSTPAGRRTLAVLDLDAKARRAEEELTKIRAEAGEREKQIETLTAWVKERDAAVQQKQGELTEAGAGLAAKEQQLREWEERGRRIEADAAQRLAQVEELTGWLKKRDSEIELRGQHIEALVSQLKASEADRAKQLELITQLGEEATQRQELIGRLEAGLWDSEQRVRSLRAAVTAVQDSRVHWLLVRMGLWQNLAGVLQQTAHTGENGGGVVVGE